MSNVRHVRAKRCIRGTVSGYYPQDPKESGSGEKQAYSTTLDG
jgi:hypothetical protein